MLMTALFAIASAAAPMPAPPATPAALVAAPTNTACPVCGRSIEPGRESKVTIRGHEYSVDEQACADALTSHPDRYLESDGTPKNAKKM